MVYVEDIKYKLINNKKSPELNVHWWGMDKKNVEHDVLENS